MPVSSKYFITQALVGEAWLDFGVDVFPFAYTGQEFTLTGTNGVDAVRVAPGLSLDFTKSNGGIDRIYLPGTLHDYTITHTTASVTLSLDWGTEQGQRVVVNKGTNSSYDLVIFADGAARTVDLHQWSGGGAAPALQAMQVAPPAAVQAVVKAFAIDASGETFAPALPGLRFIATGSNAVDSVYVTPGSVIDATKLNGGVDRIYFGGSWADYDIKTFTARLEFTHRTDGSVTTVAATTGSQNDLLIFADGAVESYAALQALRLNAAVGIEAVVGHKPLETTPVAAPRLSSAIDNVADFDVSSAIVIRSSVDISAVAGKFIRIVNDGGIGFRGEDGDSSQLIEVTDTQQVEIAGKLIIVRPGQDLDLANDYHFEIDAGAFINAKGVPSAPVASPKAINFSTVTPGSGLLGLDAAAASTAMDDSGLLVAGHRWLDIESVGSPSSDLPTKLDASLSAVAFVFKDYDLTTPADAAFDGVGAPDFFVRAEGFGDDDLVYVDNASAEVPNRLRASSVLFIDPLLDAQGQPLLDTSYTQLSFGSGIGGLGGVIELASGSATPRYIHRSAETLRYGQGPVEPVIDPISSDDIVNAADQSLVLSGGADPGGTVQLLIGARQWSAPVDELGYWQQTLDAADIAALGQGPMLLSAWVEDVAGNLSEQTNRAFLVDMLLPEAQVFFTEQALSVGERSSLVTITFTEGPIGFNADQDLIVEGGTLSAGAFDESGRVWRATFTALEGYEGTGSVALSSGSYTDAALNPGASGTGLVSIDTAAPVTTLSTDDAALNIGDDATITLTFTEAPATMPTVTPSAGTLGAFTLSEGSSGLVYTATLTPPTDTAAATISFTIGAWADAAGNTGTTSSSATVAVDTVVPTVALSTDDAALNIGDDATITLSFTEAPTSLPTVTPSEGTLSAFTLTEGSTGLVYTATLTPPANTAAATISFTIGAWADAAGNTGTTSSSATVAVDTVVPTVALSTDDAALNISDTATITLTFTEALTSLPTVTPSEGTLGAFTLTEGSTGLVYTATLTPPANTAAATISFTIGDWADAAGNTGSTTETATIAVDTVAPSQPAIDLVMGDDVIRSSEPNLAITGSAEPFGFIQLAYGGITRSVSVDDLGRWSMPLSVADLIAMGQGMETIIAVAMDAAGNVSVASSRTVMVETQPTLTSSLSGVLNLDVTSAIVLQASEAVIKGTGSIRIMNDGGAGFRGEASDHDQVIDVGSDAVTIQGDLIIVRPPFDLDLANSYHIEVDAGAFTGASSGMSSLAITDPSAIAFATVTPGSGIVGVSAAVASQNMDVTTGELVASYKWLDIEGVGSPSASTPTLRDLVSDSIALVFKDYTPEPGSADDAFDGVGAPDFFIGAQNFGVDDLLYIDDQTNSSSGNDLSLSSFGEGNSNDPSAAYYSFGSGTEGLGGVIEFPSPAAFDDLAALLVLMESDHPPIISG